MKYYVLVAFSSFPLIVAVVVEVVVTSSQQRAPQPNLADFL